MKKTGLTAHPSYYDRAYAALAAPRHRAPLASWNEHRLLSLAVTAHPEINTILDIGCGTGHLLKLAATIPGVRRLFGVDSCKAALKQAASLVADAELYQADAERLYCIPPASCDLVLMQAVVEHIMDITSAFNEVNRVLADGGVCAIYTTEFNLMKKVLVSALAFERYFNVEEGHIRFFTGRSLRSVMASHGFQRVAHEWAGSYLGILPHGQNAVFRKVADLAYTPQLNHGTV